jgi:hypothetical protein
MRILLYGLACLAAIVAALILWGNEATKDTFAGRSGISVSQCIDAFRQYSTSPQDAERTCWSTAIPTEPAPTSGGVVSLGSPGWTEPGPDPPRVSAEDLAASAGEIAKFRFVCPEKLTSDKARGEELRRFVTWAMHRNASMPLEEMADLRTKLLSDHKCKSVN